MLAQLGRISRVVRRLEKASHSHASLFWALFVSALIHAFLLVSDFGFDDSRRYPPPVVVTLVPREIPEAIPSDEVVAQEDAPALELEEPSATSAVVPNVVELTPTQADKVVPQPRVFISAAALTRKPVLLNPEWLDHAAWRLPSQAAGEVVLTLLITRDGRVEDVLVEEDASPELASWLGRELLAEARFSPGYVRDMAVDSKIRIRLELGALVR